MSFILLSSIRKDKMKYLTTIDTVSLQIDTKDEISRNFIVDGILRLLYAKKLYVKEKNYPTKLHSNFFIKEYEIYANSVSVVKIRMGSYSVKNPLDTLAVTTYYISIEFAGLKTYHDQLDFISNNTLLSICAYLNSRNILYKITSLDICIDMYTGFNNVLAFCTKKSPKTSYYAAKEHQDYDTTSYLEKIPYASWNEAVKRSYLYYKSKKEKLQYRLTRFELKLQPKFLNKYSDTLIYAISNTFDRYHVMFVRVKKVREALKDQFDKTPILRERDIKRIGFDSYRCHFDITVVKSFIVRIFSITEQDLKLP